MQRKNRRKGEAEAAVPNRYKKAVSYIKKCVSVFICEREPLAPLRPSASSGSSSTGVAARRAAVIAACEQRGEESGEGAIWRGGVKPTQTRHRRHDTLGYE